MGGRREVSIISHRPVTGSDLKQERSFFCGFNIFATGCSYSLPEWRVVKPTFFAPYITDVSNLGDFAFTLGSKTHNTRAIQLVLQQTTLFRCPLYP